MSFNTLKFKANCALGRYEKCATKTLDSPEKGEGSDDNLPDTNIEEDMAYEELESDPETFWDKMITPKMSEEEMKGEEKEETPKQKEKKELRVIKSEKKKEKKRRRKDERDAKRVLDDIAHVNEYSSDIKSYILSHSHDALSSIALSDAAVKGARLTHYVQKFCTDLDFDLIDNQSMSRLEKELCNGIGEMIGFGKLYENCSVANMTAYDVHNESFLGPKSQFIIDSEDIKAAVTPDFVRQMNEKKEKLAAEAEHPEDDEAIASRDLKASEINGSEIIKPFQFINDLVYDEETGWHPRTSSEADSTKEFKPADKSVPKSPIEVVDTDNQTIISVQEAMEKIRTDEVLQSIIGYQLGEQDIFLHPILYCILAYIKHDDQTMEYYRFDIVDGKICVNVPFVSKNINDRKLRKMDPTTGIMQHCDHALIPLTNEFAVKALRTPDFKIQEEEFNGEEMFVWWVADGLSE